MGGVIGGGAAWRRPCPRRAAPPPSPLTPPVGPAQMTIEALRLAAPRDCWEMLVGQQSSMGRTIESSPGAVRADGHQLAARRAREHVAAVYGDGP